MILDTMSFDDITLAAECISMARIEFVEKVLLNPVVAVLGGKIDKGAETQSSKSARAVKKKEIDVDGQIAAIQMLLGGTSR